MRCADMRGSLSAHPDRGGRAQPVKPLKMLVNWYGDWEIELHVGDTPPPGQPPLSRPTDQNASAPTWLALAHDTSWEPSSSWKTRPLKLRPIIGVTPSIRLRCASVFSGQICAIWPSVALAAAMTASPQSAREEPNSIVI